VQQVQFLAPMAAFSDWDQDAPPFSPDPNRAMSAVIAGAEAAITPLTFSWI